MPTTDGYGQKVPYPVLSDAPNIELAFQGAVNVLAGKSVLRFANANERSATLIGEFKAVPGMLSYLIAEDRWDRYDGDSVWRPLSPGAWKPFSFSSGYGTYSGSPGYRIINGEVRLRGIIRRTNDADLPTNVSTRFGTLPTEARPTAVRYFVAATSWSTVSGSSYFSSRVEVGTDGAMQFMVPLSSVAKTVSLDSITFSIE